MGGRYAARVHPLDGRARAAASDGAAWLRARTVEPLGMPHVHDAVQVHPRTGEACLYLPLNPEGLYDTRTAQHWAPSREVWERLEAKGFAYDHVWQEGDLLLWDNLQVLHKSGGGYGDHPRLLLRTQTMYAP